MNHRVLLPALALVAVIAASCGGGDDELLVFAAASLGDAFTDIETAFEETHPGLDVLVNLASSTSLRVQILEGAPAAVFASADTANMDAVAAAVGGVSPVTFATTDLVLAVPGGNPAGVAGLADLADPALLVGVCVPEAPCGRYAARVLTTADVAASFDTAEPNARALLGRIESGELDVGLVYRTDALAAAGRVETIEIPDEVNIDVLYPVAALEDGPAQTFVDFLLSPRGREILADHGFRTP